MQHLHPDPMIAISTDQVSTQSTKPCGHHSFLIGRAVSDLLTSSFAPFRTILYPTWGLMDLLKM